MYRYSNFWERAVNHFKTPEFIACLYDYLNNIDLKEYNWKKNKPITNLYKEWKERCTPSEISHLYEICDENINKGEGEKIIKYTFEDYYKSYKLYCADNMVHKMLSKNVLIRNLKHHQLNSLAFVKRGGNYIKFIPKEIIYELIKKGNVVDDDIKSDTGDDSLIC